MRDITRNLFISTIGVVIFYLIQITLYKLIFGFGLTLDPSSLHPGGATIVFVIINIFPCDFIGRKFIVRFTNTLYALRFYFCVSFVLMTVLTWQASSLTHSPFIEFLFHFLALLLLTYLLSYDISKRYKIKSKAQNESQNADATETSSNK